MTRTTRARALRTAGLAHDIASLVAAIRLRLEAVVRSAEGAPLRAELLGVIASAREALLLARAVTSEAMRPAPPRPLDLRGALSRMEPVLRSVLGRVRLEVPAPSRRAAPVRVRVGANAVERVLLNLAANAAQAMPRGGTVTISFGTAAFSVARARRLGLRAGRYALVEVRDDGPGVSPAIRRRLFRESGVTTRPAAHTGLGLFSARELLRSWGGAIVLGRSARGARFLIYLRSVSSR